MTSLNGWHPGERLVRKKLGFDKVPGMANAWTWIEGEMSEQHSTFYTTRLPFIPVCVLDEEGRPWASVLAGKDGHIGYVRLPRYNTLGFQARLWEGDPFKKHLKAGEQNKGSTLIAGIGVELSTRRRNKFAGHILREVVNGDTVELELVVNEAIGFVIHFVILSLVAEIILQELPKIYHSA